jgi:hypothetical protein
MPPITQPGRSSGILSQYICFTKSIDKTFVPTIQDADPPAACHGRGPRWPITISRQLRISARIDGRRRSSKSACSRSGTPVRKSDRYHRQSVNLRFRSAIPVLAMRRLEAASGSQGAVIRRDVENLSIPAMGAADIARPTKNLRLARAISRTATGR